MRILAIETSCDETAVSVVENGILVRSNVIASSKKIFEKLAGVIPEQAARLQSECMLPVLGEALETSGCILDEIDALAVTRGPGLLGSLLVGTATARALAIGWKKPLIGVHHTFGHLSSSWLNQPDEPQFPVLTLSASGGHTDLWLRHSHLHNTLIGRTRDDAAGEAFDKGASMLGLGYPGGPLIAAEAEHGNPSAHTFPLPLHEENTFDFSFSGLKTSLKYLIRDSGDALNLQDVAASFEFAICRHLLHRLKNVVSQHRDIREIHLVGGVSANRKLRSMLKEFCDAQGLVARWPAELSFCTDNAAMIAGAAYFSAIGNPDEAFRPFETEASLPLQRVVS